MDLKEYMYWIVNSGGGALVASFILEKIPWYQKQTSENKLYIYFAAIFGVTVAGYLGLTYIPAEVIAMISPYFAIFYTAFGSVFLGTAYHKVTKANKE